MQKPPFGGDAGAVPNINREIDEEPTESINLVSLAIPERIRQAETAAINQPHVTIDLREFVRSGKPPTNNEIGLRVAKSPELDFTDEEIALYAVQQGKKRATEFGEAFYGGKTDSAANKFWLDRAATDPAGGRVTIGEMDPGAIQNLTRWRNEHRAHLDPRAEMERAKLTAFEEVYKHIHNPAAAFAESGLKTIGDIVQGVGLLAHPFHGKTFMDDLAKFLREKGESLPMMGLYTDEELQDAFVCLANLAGSASGAAAVYRGTGGIAEFLKLTPAAAAFVVDAAGAFGNAGQVYDSSMTRQAYRAAMSELQQGKIDESKLQRRAQEIKDGKGDQTEFAHMERNALVSAAFAVPAGVVQARVLSRLGSELRSGTAVKDLPADLVRDLAADLAPQMGKGAAFAVTTLAANEGAMVIGGAQTTRQAVAQLNDNMGATAIGGAVVFAANETLVKTEVAPRNRTTGIQTHEEPINNAAHVSDDVVWTVHERPVSRPAAATNESPFPEYYRKRLKAAQAFEKRYINEELTSEELSRFVADYPKSDFDAQRAQELLHLGPEESAKRAQQLLSRRHSTAEWSEAQSQLASDLAQRRGHTAPEKGDLADAARAIEAIQSERSTKLWRVDNILTQRASAHPENAADIAAYRERIQPERQELGELQHLSEVKRLHDRVPEMWRAPSGTRTRWGDAPTDGTVLLPGALIYAESHTPDQVLLPNDLPPVPEGLIRLVHYTMPDNATGIARDGLAHSGITSTTTTTSKSGSDLSDYLCSDRRYNGTVAVIMEVPIAEYNNMRRSGGGVVPPKYVIGVLGMPKSEQPAVNKDPNWKPSVRNVGGGIAPGS